MFLRAFFASARKIEKRSPFARFCENQSRVRQNECRQNVRVARAYECLGQFRALGGAWDKLSISCPRQGFVFVSSQNVMSASPRDVAWRASRGTKAFASQSLRAASCANLLSELCPERSGDAYFRTELFHNATRTGWLAGCADSAAMQNQAMAEANPALLRQ